MSSPQPWPPNSVETSPSSSVSCVSSLTPNLLYVQFPKPTTNKESNPYEASVPDGLIACMYFLTAMAIYSPRHIFLALMCYNNLISHLDWHHLSSLASKLLLMAALHPEIKSFCTAIHWFVHSVNFLMAFTLSRSPGSA